MRLFKYCEEQYNVAMNSNTIQVGTVKYYQKHFDRFIRDINESKYSNALSFAKPTTFSGDEINKRFKGAINIQGGIQMNGNAFRHTQQYPNAFVYCCSTKSDSLDVGLGYNSAYEIINPTEFLETVGHEIINHYHIPINLKCYHQQVTYVDEKVSYHNNLSSIFKSLDEPSIQDVYFSKDKVSIEHSDIKFEDNAEYRFLFIPIDGQKKTIKVSETPIIIDVNRFKHLFRMVN